MPEESQAHSLLWWHSSWKYRVQELPKQTTAGPDNVLGPSDGIENSWSERPRSFRGLSRTQGDNGVWHLRAGVKLSEVCRESLEGWRRYN
jgi:hypothetical protein